MTHSTRILEIEKIIKDFEQQFQAGVSDPDHFITMSEIERLWTEMQDKTNNIYSDMVRELMNKVDERELIKRKKENTSPRG